MSEKKKQQLGMNPSTASARLLKDILFNLIKELNKDNCFHCGEKLTRETFSIEHMVPWLDGENPLELFFDLNNISFSHLLCNCKAARTSNKKYFTKEEKLEADRKWNREYMRRRYSTKARREKYTKMGY